VLTSFFAISAMWVEISGSIRSDRKDRVRLFGRKSSSISSAPGSFGRLVPHAKIVPDADPEQFVLANGSPSSTSLAADAAGLAGTPGASPL